MGLRVTVVEPSTLYLVATPIGNLGDVTARALEVLRGVDLIACEDTRHSRVLLDAHGISTPTTSLPAFAEGARADALVARLAGGASIALISDAGSPAISDPGERLVAECRDAGLPVVPIPGPSAVIAALSASGLPTSRFHFLGFLPRTASDARAMLDEVSGLSATVVLFESPRRLVDTLALLQEALGDRPACVARELTKRHEAFSRGALSALEAAFSAREVLGEVVIVVRGREAATRWSEAELLAALDAGLARGERLKPLSTELARASGWSSQDVYRRGIARKGG
ncbi:MAG: 16S rRNA (cytidine(1402)-2'-O)-methyltransferase [Myxococcaceae bacterium]|jgi:16S rRNA (cytidine1402-2'-O)-methyltransferase|nr:16S rRNA (cytidine(1402)-2'-O)-methyltransferase [Myxococcaceae bacterium]MCA3013005.1 16S rRNA (cytidine(1402)-2'-O)-methyltransferase [Myxococcaceae bacterium]